MVRRYYAIAFVGHVVVVELDPAVWKHGRRIELIGETALHLDLDPRAWSWKGLHFFNSPSTFPRASPTFLTAFLTLLEEVPDFLAS